MDQDKNKSAFDETPEQIERRARQRVYQREWRKKNAEKYYAKQRERRAKNREKNKAWSLAWREKNRERLNAKAREYRKNNLAKCRAKFSRYQEKNRAKLYEKWGYNEAVRRGCPVSNREGVLAVYQKAVDLSKSTGIKWSVDHIISLSMKGHHCPENVQAMPMDINQIKSGNPFWICPDGVFKDWRDVPVKFWPKEFIDTYNAVVSHAESGRPFFSMSA